jgi:anti-anti-sigma factor
MIRSRIFSNKNFIAFQNVNKLNILNINEIIDFLKKKFEDSDKDIYLDLTGINFIDSFAFEKLIAIHHIAISSDRKFKLFNVSDELREIFVVAGISNQLHIVDTREVIERLSHEYQMT